MSQEERAKAGAERGTAEEPGMAEILTELQRALQQRPPRIPSKHFYDDRGSRLFEEICELPEYYLTRTEAWILRQVAPEVARLTRAEELVELGAGAATKTRILIQALNGTGTLRLYVPFDVSETMVRQVTDELAAEFPGLGVHGVVGDFLAHLDRIPRGHRRLMAFLGSTLGNLEPAEALDFLSRLRATMVRGEHFLLGVDLVKDVGRLEAAYNDSQGVTAEFNRNILRVVNRLADGDFRPEGFRHRAFYRQDRQWIEMRLVSKTRQIVRLRRLDLILEFAPGEEILTEISSKYTRPQVEDLLARSGFEAVGWYTDPEELFALSLSQAR